LSRTHADLSITRDAVDNLGPFDTEQQVRELPAVREVYEAFGRDPGVGKMAPHSLRMLLDALAGAGVYVGRYDLRIAEWLAGWEPQTVAVIAGWVQRARQADDQAAELARRRAAAAQQRYRASPKGRATRRAMQARRQARTGENARRHGCVWTESELETASRDDLTTTQAALVLGRSHKAVQGIRRRLRAGDQETARREASARRDRVQARTLEAARRRGYVWTGPELEIASRRDLSTQQVALMLGRTYWAVEMIRRQLRADPRKALVAGIAAERPDELREGGR